jgi:hypothetical protein
LIVAIRQAYKKSPAHPIYAKAMRGAVEEAVMFGKNLALLSALCLAAVPGAAAAEGPKAGSKDGIKQDSVKSGPTETGGQSYGDRNRGGPYGFYSYPRHRHIDGGSGGGLESRLLSGDRAGTSPNYDATHGSAYYGRDYGAPYFNGGYYDRGIYYRERRD